MKEPVLLTDLRAVLDLEHDLARIDPSRRGPDELEVALSGDISLHEGAEIQIWRLEMGQYQSFSNDVIEGDGTVP
jgi:hypothetical protein